MDTLEPQDDLFALTRGVRDAEILIVGEAWEAEEAAARKPFVGSSGKELDRMLADAGLASRKILFTNVVSARPPGNDFTSFLHPNSEKKAHVHRGLKPKPELLRGLEKLERLIATVQPRLIIGAGNIPLWALSDHATISTKKGHKLPSGAASWRGSQTTTIPIRGRTYPFLPIIHPAAILREWSFRQITVHDLRTRAGSLLSGSSWTSPPHQFTPRPTISEVRAFFTSTRRSLAEGVFELAVDLETYRRRWISVVGLADGNSALCIPLFYVEKGQIQSYFPLDQEIEIFQQLKMILEHPNVRIIGQNFIYDTEWFFRYYNINAIVSFDTMVAHHLLFPGTPKRLDYLASLYCDHYCYWKDESGDWEQFPEDHLRYWTYNCKDTRATYDAAQALKGAIKQQGLEELLAFQMEQWKISRDLTLRGIRFNSTLQKEMRLILFEEANAHSQWLLEAVPDFCKYTSTGKPWYDSPKGTARLLYEVIGLHPVMHKKTKKPTTDDSALAELQDREPILSPLLERLRHLRSLGVFINTFLLAKTSDDGRMRPSFNIAHPETFRWSSNKNGFGEGLNGQNIPKGDKDDLSELGTEEEAVSSLEDPEAENLS